MSVSVTFDKASWDKVKADIQEKGKSLFDGASLKAF